MSKRLFAAAIAAVLFSSCYYTPSGTAAADVKFARALGSNITGDITLTVSGSGMETITRTYPATASGTEALTVPSGVSRTFTVTASSASASLSGSTTVDLSPGETRSIVLDPVLTAVKILVPDYMNGRVVQIDDMTGANWSETNGSQIIPTSPPPNLNAYKIDYDNQGKLYIGRASFDSFLSSVIELDDINSTQADGGYTPVQTLNNSANSVSLDRQNNLVYYLQGQSVFYKSTADLTGTASSINLPTSEFLGAIPDKMAVDGRGIFFFTSQLYKTIYSFDPTLPVNSQVLTYTSAIETPYDVMVKGDYVYVTDYGLGGAGGQKIVQLTRGLALVAEFTGPTADPLWGPTGFISTADNRIIFLDEDRYSPQSPRTRLVSITDMAGAGWQTYGSFGSGVGQFRGFQGLP